MRYLVPEIFDKLAELKTEAEKIAWLQKHKEIGRAHV